MGRPEARRYDLQRHQNIPHDRCRLAWQRGLIHDVNDYAGDYMPPGVDLFEAPAHQKIKWDHLLRQTSDWQEHSGGKPDWADRPEGDKPADWPNRKFGSRALITSTTTSA